MTGHQKRVAVWMAALVFGAVWSVFYWTTVWPWLVQQGMPETQQVKP